MIEVGVEVAQGAVEPMGRADQAGADGLIKAVEDRREEPLVELGEVQHHARTAVGQGVPVSAMHLAQQAFAPQLHQLVAQARGRDLYGLGTEPVNEHFAQLGVRKGLEGEPGTPERGQQPHDLGDAEPKSGDVLPSLDGGG